jgi:hypothetical protein
MAVFAQEQTFASYHTNPSSQTFETDGTIITSLEEVFGKYKIEWLSK